MLHKHWPSLRLSLVPMVTSGDTFLKNNLAEVGGKGLFVKELEEALLQGEADIAVHSMKDVPHLLPDGLCIAAICTRENPLDAFISQDKIPLEQLPPHSIIGTASLRRQSQVLKLRPDCRVHTIRGNVHTRLGKLETQDCDAIILATAGLIRLSLKDKITEILDADRMLPACGQGAMGIECRTADTKILEILAAIHDELSSLCVLAERHVNGLLGGNCHVPLAVYCKPEGDNTIFLRAKILSSDGKTSIDFSGRGKLDDAMGLAQACAEDLLARGGAELLAEGTEW